MLNRILCSTFLLAFLQLGCGTSSLPGIPTCGDFACNSSETCVTCPRDCGACNAPHCGDAACNGTEYCANCSLDCGLCEPTACGDGSCNEGESCSTCPNDCGNCVACGDGTCAGNENCSTCPSDCGGCSTCYEFDVTGTSYTTISYDPTVTGGALAWTAWGRDNMDIYYFPNDDSPLFPGETVTVQLQEHGNDSWNTCSVCVVAHRYDENHNDRYYLGQQGAVTLTAATRVGADFRIELDNISLVEISDAGAPISGGECASAEVFIQGEAETWGCSYFPNSVQGYVEDGDSVCTLSFDADEADQVAYQLVTCECDELCEVVATEMCAPDEECTYGEPAAAYCQ